MSAQENRILRLREVMQVTGLSKTTIHRRYGDGTFLRPLRLGPQSIGWRRTEIFEWLESLPRGVQRSMMAGNVIVRLGDVLSVTALSAGIGA